MKNVALIIYYAFQKYLKLLLFYIKSSSFEVDCHNAVSYLILLLL